jgi:hypothetical protein
MVSTVSFHNRPPSALIHFFGPEPQLPITDANPSPNIARIFGTNTTAFELLALKRNIMGPCWLQIKNPKIENKSVSTVSFENRRFIYRLPVFLVQTGGHCVGSQGHKSLSRDGPQCTEGYASTDGDESECSHHCKPP